jgi:hypothetical protein
MECPDKINLCLECLRTGKTKAQNGNSPKVGEEKGPHKESHKYFILDNLNFPLLMKDWSAKEELQLLQGIMKCGLGNWKEISD